MVIREAALSDANDTNAPRKPPASADHMAVPRAAPQASPSIGLPSRAALNNSLTPPDRLRHGAADRCGGSSARSEGGQAQCGGRDSGGVESRPVTNFFQKPSQKPAALTSPAGTTITRLSPTAWTLPS
ncbi:hypothetical protein GCM10023238_36960 [Streptomyces heliomycini]